MTIEFTVSAIVPASPEAIYDAWLDSDGHTKMTGSPAHATANVGDSFDAWDGYISGKNLELERGKRILQSWRGSRYKDSDRDSQIEVVFEPVDGGTKITLTHMPVKAMDSPKPERTCPRYRRQVVGATDRLTRPALTMPGGRNDRDALGNVFASGF